MPLPWQAQTDLHESSGRVRGGDQGPRLGDCSQHQKGEGALLSYKGLGRRILTGRLNVLPRLVSNVQGRWV